ncbi:MAG: tetratricopeptide repeat protein [Pseudomonadota bacterium]
MSSTTPFWEQLPTILRYPLKVENQLAIGVLAILGALASGFFILSFFVWIATYNYAHGVLVHTALGHMEPRRGYFDQIASTTAFKQLALWFILGLPAGIMHVNFGYLASVPTALAMLSVLPIATISLAMDQSLTAALNPLTWRTAIAHMGGDYGRLLGVLALIVLPTFAISFVLSLIPFFGVLANEWLLRCMIVAVFFLLGYVVYQYHHEFETALDEIVVLEQTPAAPDPTLSAAQAMLDDGDVAGARRFLFEAMNSEGPRSAAADALLTLSKAQGDVAGKTAVRTRRVEMYLADEQYSEALAEFDAARVDDPTLAMPAPEYSLQLTKAVEKSGDSRRALQLAQAFVRDHPGHKDVIGHAFLAGRILTDRLGRDEEALKIFRQLVQRYPNHPQLDQIVRQRDRVQAIVSGKV